MFNRHQAYDAPESDRRSFVDPSVPSRACCCPARPMVKVIMPPTPDRPRPVDLWLCGHHYRASLVALELAGARIEDLNLRAGEPYGDRAPIFDEHSRVLYALDGCADQAFCRRRGRACLRARPGGRDLAL